MSREGGGSNGVHKLGGGESKKRGPRPEAEPDPEHSVGRAEQRPGPLTVEYGKLVTEDGVLSRQGGAGTSHASEGPEDQKEL